MIYGIIIDKEAHNHIFSQGNETKNMPTADKFTYNGMILRNSLRWTNIKFEVDFTNKRLTGFADYTGGSINSHPNLITIEAKINGNKFAGNNGYIETKGGFYGPNAKEMSGVYKEVHNQFYGAFGAVKQEK